MDIQAFIDNYLSWIRSEMHFSQMGDYYEITTPLLDSTGDYLQLYVKQEGDEIVFSDDANTINSLIMAGLTLSKNRKTQIAQIARTYGITVQPDYELTARTAISNAPQAKQLFLQGMVEIGDLYLSAQRRTGSFFIDDVNTFFQQQDIFASENIAMSGASGYSRVYNFLFPRSRKYPERLCNVLNEPTKDKIDLNLFYWIDTKKTRKPDSKFILLLNDSKNISPAILGAIKSYDASYIKWSERLEPENLALLAS
jgi:hypothetical protein|nr:MAG TPA: protein of unknown function DUF1829 [Caudoviricetes sp.]